ncbi:MAG: hypothetical protein IPN88_19265 [Bacteroidetes bacterium]|nr:hypothetical protein [Bacteroidota bacterium]
MLNVNDQLTTLEGCTNQVITENNAVTVLVFPVADFYKVRIRSSIFNLVVTFAINQLGTDAITLGLELR